MPTYTVKTSNIKLDKNKKKKIAKYMKHNNSVLKFKFQKYC